MLVTDQNANQIIQYIVEKASPQAYVVFFKNLIENSPDGVKSIAEDKYGCRVIQKCLERVVKLSFGEDKGYYMLKVSNSRSENMKYIFRSFLNFLFKIIDNIS
jgi:hypothetical protein